MRNLEELCEGVKGPQKRRSYINLLVLVEVDKTPVSGRGSFEKSLLILFPFVEFQVFWREHCDVRGGRDIVVCNVEMK